MMEKIPWLNNVKKNLELADKKLGTVNPFLKTAKMFLDVTDEVLDAIPVTKAITTGFSIVDKFLVEYMEQTKILDEDHEAARFQLNARFQEKIPSRSTNFCRHCSQWMWRTGLRLPATS